MEGSEITATTKLKLLEAGYTPLLTVGVCFTDSHFHCCLRPLA